MQATSAAQSFGSTTTATASAAATSLQDPFAALSQHLAMLTRDTAKPNWDSEQGTPVLPHTWRRVHAFFRTLAEEFSVAPEPHVSASGDGYVHLMWHRENGDRAVLEIGPGQCYWSVLSVDGAADTEELITFLRDAVPKLRDFVAVR